jgi:hypothetical protein
MYGKKQAGLMGTNRNWVIEVLEFPRLIGSGRLPRKTLARKRSVGRSEGDARPSLVLAAGKACPTSRL